MAVEVEEYQIAARRLAWQAGLLPGVTSRKRIEHSVETASQLRDIIQAVSQTGRPALLVIDLILSGRSLGELDAGEVERLHSAVEQMCQACEKGLNQAEKIPQRTCGNFF